MESTATPSFVLVLCLVAFTASSAVLAAPAAAEEAAKAPFYADKTNLLAYIDAAGVSHAVTTPAEWQIRRGHVIENFQLASGTLPGAERRVSFDLRVEEETDFPTYVRKKITFGVEPGDRLSAYLLVPKGLAGQAPAMVCLHPTFEFGKNICVGLGGKPNRDYGRELAERGYVTISPDYPGFGECHIDVYAMGYASATAKGIWNHMRCVDLLQSMPEVDGARIGAIGHSLGGHNTLFLGLFDERVKVMVSSCGFCAFAKYYAGNLTGWTHKGYMPRIDTVFGKDPARMPFDFTEVLACLAPRSVFVNAPVKDENFDVGGVKDCLAAARPVFALFGVPDHLEAMHPDCEHDFPNEARAAAYAFIDKALAHTPRAHKIE